jgi:DNA repair exonuclease SbcCD nuclease subunit
MLIFSGDWHGDWKNVIREIKRLDLRDCTVFQVGDFGMGFTTMKKDLRALQFLNITLKARNIMLYAIRGNHDNPIYFDGSISKSNIKLLSDYTVIRVDEKNILCVGGAISIDRKANPEQTDLYGKQWPGRKEGTNYWPNEEFVFIPDKIKELNNIDIVITHSSPDFCEPRIKTGLSGWAKYDLGLIEACAKERNDHSKMFDMLKANGCPLEYWLYGHFHYSKREYFDNVQFVLLDIIQFYELRV